MPGRDGKGPQGAGPKKGKRRSNCLSGTNAGTATDLRGAGRGGCKGRAPSGSSAAAGKKESKKQ